MRARCSGTAVSNRIAFEIRLFSFFTPLLSFSLCFCLSRLSRFVKSISVCAMDVRLAAVPVSTLLELAIASNKFGFYSSFSQTAAFGACMQQSRTHKSLSFIFICLSIQLTKQKKIHNIFTMVPIQSSNNNKRHTHQHTHTPSERESI